MASVLEYHHFIDGAWTPGESGEMMEVINPCNQEVVARVPRGTKADVDKAVESARRTFESGVWSEKSVEERAAVLMKAFGLIVANKSKLAYLESLTSGGTIRRTYGVDLGSVAGTVLTVATILKQLPKAEYASMQIGGLPMHSYWRREPIGVCAGICPWNLPLLITNNKIAPAIAMGNSIVIKPASITPVTALEIARIFKEAGLPDGVLNVITGPGSSAGNYLAGHPDVDKVSLTGSTEVGRQIIHQSADTIKRVTVELGGKSPILVLDDADMAVATVMCLLAFLLHSGQACESGTRLFVPRHMQDELAGRMIEKIKKMRIGDQLLPETDLGPIASEDQVQTIARYVKIGQQEGAQLACGGNRLTHGIYEKGFFFEPTIFMNCNNQMTQVREEIFGPVQCVIPYDDLDEAVAMANDSIYGLGGGVCTTDAGRGQKIANKLRTGTVWINNWHALRPDAPFGGYKQSGYGRECCYHGLLAYSEVKHICQDLTPDGAHKHIAEVIGCH